MDFSKAVVHGGLSLKGAATGQGITWAPRIGTAAVTTPLPDADVGESFFVTFPEATGRMDLVAPRGFIAAGGLLAALDTLVVTGITGTDEALVNVTYTRSATLYNAAPQWTNGTAVIRLDTEGLWEIALAGVPQFRSTLPYVSPSFVGSALADAGAAGTGGTPEIVPGASGDVPVATVDVLDPVDPEGLAFPALSSHRAFEIVVTAGSGLFATNTLGRDPLALPAGGRMCIVTPAAVPAGIMPYFTFFASEPGTVIRITTVGVAA